MLSPLVSWILPSSSSSSSSEGEDMYVTDDGDHYENVGENEHFLSEADHEFPSTSCAGDTIPCPVDASPSVTIAFPGPAPHDSPVIPNTQKRQRINNSRRQYQRLWTKQDEIELLRGYLDYIKKHRWATTSLQNDVAFFYDHVRPKLNTSFDKSQLVHKLRGLKRKHNIALNKINSGRDVSHKNPQDETIFHISHRIWGKNRDHESSPDLDDTDNFDNVKVENEEDEGNVMENARPRRKRPRATTNDENNGHDSIQNLVEETIRSCLSPKLKEVLNNAVEGSPLRLVEQYGNGEVGDEKWRTQRILELEAYLKQLELLQEQIKARIEELRSSGG